MIVKYIVLLLMVHAVAPNQHTADTMNRKFVDDMIGFTVNCHHIFVSVTLLNQSLVWTARSPQYGIICTFVTTDQSYTICSNDSTAKMKRIKDYNSQKATFKSSFRQPLFTGEYDDVIPNRSHRNLKHLIIHTIRDTLINECRCIIHEIPSQYQVYNTNTDLFRLSL
jgi:hypothetical protein